MPRLASAFTVLILFLILAADLGWGATLFNWVALVPGRDFTGHFVLIGLLSLTINLAIRRRSIRIFKLPVQLGSLLLGPIVAVEEISQLWIETRGFSLLDLAADFLGICLLGGAASAWIWRRWRSHKQLPRSGVPVESEV
jgi:predicted Kef-type K+ transport protein